MAELVDAPDSKSSDSNIVWVRFPLRPPLNRKNAKGVFLTLHVRSTNVNPIQWKVAAAIASIARLEQATYHA